MKINNFRGDLTDISAKKEALDITDICATTTRTVEERFLCQRGGPEGEVLWEACLELSSCLLKRIPFEQQRR